MITPHRNASVLKLQRMVVKFYNYTNTVRTCTDTMRTVNVTKRIRVYAAEKTVDYWAEVFLHQSKQHMF